MKNFDKYMQDILIESNEQDYQVTCWWRYKYLGERTDTECSCDDCTECQKQFFEWLNQEYKEPVKLTKVQYEILKCLQQDSLILISNNELIIHKDNLEMFMNKLGVKIIDSDNHEEKSIKIKDILKKCEVVE